ncbi:MAG: hypothetical protein P8Z70_07870 [Desulfuromonadales bacterium]|jgi:outer membrane murein-binding lipoprotein Lpp
MKFCRRKRITLFLIALSALILPGCASFQKSDAERAAQNRETREKIRQLQEKLNTLQEQLAIMKGQKALEATAKPESPPAWSPLTRTGDEKAGYGLYTYILDREVESGKTGGLLLSVLGGITALPGRTDLPPKDTNRFLVPMNDPGGKPDSANYNAVLAGKYLDLVGASGLEAKGPLLVSSFQPLRGEEKTPLLILNPSYCDPNLLNRIFPAYLGKVEPVPSEGSPLFATLFWKIVQLAGPDSVTVTQADHVLVLGCPR